MPTLLFVLGPPAVGKMTVGHEIAARTGFRLFHNHHAIDLALRFFPFGSAPFGRLVGDFRRRIFEEVAASDLPGLVFTYVWAFNLASDAVAVEEYAMNSGGEFDGREDYLRIDNTALSAAEVAERVVERFTLPPAPSHPGAAPAPR